MAARLLIGIAVLSSGCSFELVHGLDESRANEVLAALERAGVVGDKRAEDPGHFTIAVPRNETGRAIALLEARALPRRAAQGTGEAFAERGLLPSPLAERARLQASIAADLERSIALLPGVSLVRVHLALPEEDPLRQTAGRPRPTASLIVLANRSLTVSENDLRRLVANAVHDLQPSDVSVVMTKDEAVTKSAPLASVGPLRVATESRPLLLLLLSGALLVILGLSTVILATRLRATER